MHSIVTKSILSKTSSRIFSGVVLGALVVLAFAGVARAENPLAGLPVSIVKAHQGLIDADICQADTPEAPISAPLSDKTVLYFVPCSYGAYQGSMRGYILDNHGSYIMQGTTLAYDENAKALVGNQELMEAAYDAKTHILSTFEKGRGPADCGQSSQSLLTVGKYGEVSVKTFEIRDKEQCDGRYGDWPIVFKQ